MARIRSLKPEFWADEELGDLPRDARLLYMGLWNFADEHGRLRGDPRYVKGQVFPYDDDLDADAVGRLLDVLAAAGKVHRYRHAGHSYMWLPNLGKHQRLESEKVPSRLPEPTGVDAGPPEPTPPTGRRDSSVTIDGPRLVETAETPSEQHEGPGADSCARGADKSALLYGSEIMDQVAGNHHPRARAQAPLVRRLLAIDDDEALEVIDKILRQHRPKNPGGYIRTMHRAGDLAGVLAEVRDDRARSAAAAHRREQLAAAAEAQDRDEQHATPEEAAAAKAALRQLLSSRTRGTGQPATLGTVLGTARSA